MNTNNREPNSKISALSSRASPMLSTFNINSPRSPLFFYTLTVLIISATSHSNGAHPPLNTSIHYQIYIDPNTQQPLAADERMPLHQATTPVPTESVRRVEGPLSSTRQKAPPAEEIIDLPDGGRMINLNGHFRAKFNVHRDPQSSTIKGSCHIQNPVKP